ncbi:MAG: histidine--tRNA ligase, partial [Acidobacteriota bacterium]|nr:histidine--tRNA ligase [Acidobacteriota bacterium]
GEEGNQLIFKVLKRGEKLDANDKDLADLALRYDLTVPLARVVAQHKNDLPRFFKRYQIQPVWRADRPARGRFREFYQCDVDAIGSSSMIVEAELCLAANEILQRVGFDDFTIRVNHRALLYTMLNAVEIVESKQTDALVALDKLDKIGAAGVLKEFENRGINKHTAIKLLNLFDNLKESDNLRILSSLSEFVGNNETGRQAINQISSIIKLTNLGSIKVDASLARGLSYYTGAIFEVNVPDLAGSIASGGRYDDLIGMFGKEQIPACGFSLGLERILFVMNERGMFPPELDANAADVLVTVWNEESTGESLTLANELREKGLRVLVYPEANKIDKQLKYASQLNIGFVCIIGDAEIAENKVTLKNMRTREQETIERKLIFGKIKQ